MVKKNVELRTEKRASFDANLANITITGARRW